MNDAEKIAALVDSRLEQATEAIAAAELNLANGLNRSAVNRVYYAMFYSVLALLATRQAETSRHSGAIALFDRWYVKLGLLPKEFSQWLHSAFLYRQSADYGAEMSIAREEIETLLTRARQFLEGVRRYLQANPPHGPDTQ